MKILKNMSIKLKVMLPIAILGIAVLLAGISSLINSKRLLNAGVVISNDCSQSIELLMDMSADLESMGKICMRIAMRITPQAKTILKTPLILKWKTCRAILMNTKSSQ